MDKTKVKVASRERRHRRVRGRVSGTAERPRLCVTRTNANIYAQLIDDVEKRTLVSSSTVDPEVRKMVKIGSNTGAAREVGLAIGRLALEAGLTTIVFDRGGNLYHGRVKALAEGAREAGLQF